MIHFRHSNPTSSPVAPPPTPPVKDPSVPLDLKIVSFVRRVLHDVTEPSNLAGMVVAGGLFRLARASLLGGIIASPATRVLAQGWGAEAAAGLAGFAVEGAAFPLASRLSARAMGRPTSDLSAADFASSYCFLGGLRFGGWSARALTSVIGSGTGLSAALVHQASMLGGIHLGYLGQQLGHAAGLPLPAISSPTLAQSLRMLAQFNLAGPLVSKLDPKFAAWERAILQRAGTLRQGPPSAQLDNPLLAHELSSANGGKVPFSNSQFRIEDELGPTHREMAARKIEEEFSPDRHSKVEKKLEAEGGRSGHDQSGIIALRPVTQMHFPITGPNEGNIQTFIEFLPYPVAVAVRQRRFGLPHIVMVNQKFVREFAWEREWIHGKSVATLFQAGNVTALMFSRIMSNLTGVLLGRPGPVEFDPTPMDLRMGNEGVLSCIGAGIYLKLGDTTYAFGIFTQLKVKSQPPQFSGDTNVSIRPPAPSGNPPAVKVQSLYPLNTVSVPGADLSTSRSHFREALKALQGSRSTPAPAPAPERESDKP